MEKKKLMADGVVVIVVVKRTPHVAVRKKLLRMIFLGWLYLNESQAGLGTVTSRVFSTSVTSYY